MINILDEHIKEVEKLLIGGVSFETDERIPFIKNLKSCDLLAVPGSGKTTALLAKLYCLAKHLPLENESGILVLAHTNTAVNEIDKKLKSVVPELFEYPNFIGTIQTFINTFFVVPFFSNFLGGTSLRIDSNIYNDEIKKRLWKGKKVKGVNYYLRNNLNFFYNSRFKFLNNRVVLVNDFYSNDDFKINKIPQKWEREKVTEEYKKNIYNFIRSLKKELLEEGILHYDDCYFIADKYINMFPQITTLLRKRFKYVFIDEMQDLESYQIELIDKIFYGDDSETVIQRIGDLNQSIYNSENGIKTISDWKVRNPIYLNNSYRLTKETAGVVNLFTLDRQKDDEGNPRFIVNGIKKLQQSIKPHLLIFDNSTKHLLKGKFSELIRYYGLDTINEGRKYGFNIIGWSAKSDEENSNSKLRLEDIFSDYKKNELTNNITFDSLSKYIQYFNKGLNEISLVRENIINAILHFLRIKNIKQSVIIKGIEKKRFYTKSSLIKYIKEGVNDSDYELFKSKVYKWVFEITTKKQYEQVYDDIKGFINKELKDWFNYNISENDNEFLGSSYEKYILIDNEQSNNDVDIKIGTIHSVKGQTHCATMYVETYYFNYETNKKFVKEALTGENHSFNLNSNNDKRGKEAFKMLYVGFSRPTHLLCFAVLKQNIQNYIDNLQGWQVVDLTEQ